MSNNYKAKELLEQMTLSEKIGQMTQMYYNGNNTQEIIEAIKMHNIGSIILCGSAFAGNSKELEVSSENLKIIQETAINETRMGIPLLFGRDVIHGHRTVYPINLAMACSFNPSLVQKCYEDIRDEAFYDGVHWTYSPMIDFCHDPRWGRIIECQGEDPYLSSKMATAIVKGFQSDDISNERVMIACTKHYIGYGASEGGRDYNHTEISDYALWNNYIPPFRAAIEAGVGTVMNSFNEINGVPVAASRRILTDILRDKLNFNGFVISDWGAIAQIKRHGLADNDSDCSKMALHAGIDMDMADNCYLNSLQELVEQGEVPIEEIDTAVLRILKTKREYGLFETPVNPKTEYDLDEHKKNAESICCESMVLLKNTDNILPLKKDTKVAITGPFAKNVIDHNGSWSLADEKLTVPTLVQTLGDKFGPNNVEYIEDMNQEYYTASKSNIVICALGEPRSVTGEAHSLANIDFPRIQLELLRRLKANGKKIIGVLFFGRPIGLQEAEPYMDAIIYAWHGGTMITKALSNVISGDAEPSGRLAVTIPRTTGQIPLYYNALPGARNMNGYYGEEGHITLNYEDCSGTPMYPFGYGLSFTRFEYSDITISKNTMKYEELLNGETFKLSVDIKNQGDRAGTEVVQLYVRDKVASRVRPLKELKGFKKISLLPDESERVTFKIGKNQLGFYDEFGEYSVERGEFLIYIGNSCLTDKKVEISIN